MKYIIMFFIVWIFNAIIIIRGGEPIISIFSIISLGVLCIMCQLDKIIEAIKKGAKADD